MTTISRYVVGVKIWNLISPTRVIVVQVSKINIYKNISNTTYYIPKLNVSLKLFVNLGRTLGLYSAQIMLINWSSHFLDKLTSFYTYVMIYAIRQRL